MFVVLVRDSFVADGFLDVSRNLILALMMAARVHGFKRTAEDVVPIVRIGDATLRKRIAEFSLTPAAELTPAEFETMDIKSDTTVPPSFVPHRNCDSLQVASLPIFDCFDFQRKHRIYEEKLINEALTKIDPSLSQVDEPSNAEQPTRGLKRAREEPDEDEEEEGKEEEDVRVKTRSKTKAKLTAKQNEKEKEEDVEEDVEKGGGRKKARTGKEIEKPKEKEKDNDKLKEKEKSKGKEKEKEKDQRLDHLIDDILESEADALPADSVANEINLVPLFPSYC